MNILQAIIRLLGIQTQILLHKRLAVVTLITLAFCLNLGTQGHCMSSQNSYIPPEILHSNFLSHRVSVAKKININHASMQELMSLPGVDQNIALKIMRVRPIEDIRDLSKIQYLSPKVVQQLIEGVKNRVAY